MLWIWFLFQFNSDLFFYSALDKGSRRGDEPARPALQPRAAVFHKFWPSLVLKIPGPGPQEAHQDQQPCTRTIQGSWNPTKQ